MDSWLRSNPLNLIRLAPAQGTYLILSSPSPGSFSSGEVKSVLFVRFPWNHERIPSASWRDTVRSGVPKDELGSPGER